ncbi:MAG TPA: hypothetical protein VM095_20480 [Pyrinomonadaceae bacterium]|nr:hypothetical protein [Pyrinomonadaceae bacterium]
MKRCPACNRTYTDDQNFCLDDGTTLVGQSSGSYNSSDAPTANIQYSGSSAPTEYMHGNPTSSGRPMPTSPPPAFMPPYAQNVQNKRSPLPWIIGGVAVLVIGIAVALLLSNRKTTTGTTGGTTPGATPSYSPSTSSSSSSWETVDGDGFTLSMPGTPSKNDSTIPSAAGPLQLRMYTLSKGFEGYITGYTEYPDIVFTSSQPEDLLNGAQNGAISNVKGEVTSQRPISVNGNPGREIIGTSPAQNIGFTARVILAKPRMYMLVYTQYDKSKPISEDGKKFLDSFQLTR